MSATGSVRELTMAQAIREAIAEEMRRDEDVILIGEDVGAYGGNFKVSVGLMDEFGEERVRDTPISESAIVGAALGAAVTGLRPVAEIMFADFLAVCLDQVVNQAAKARYMSGGKLRAPLVIRTAFGGGRSSAAQHSQSPHAWIAQSPGLLVAMPSSPYEAKGLLKTAIRCDDPVVFFEHKMAYNKKGPVPEEEYVIPFGKANITRQGKHVTVVATSTQVLNALDAADTLAADGIEAEVIDLRTVVPLDRETVCASVRKTGRAVVADEGHLFAGVASEIAAQLCHDVFDYLDAPIERVTTAQTPIPFSPPLENAIVPSADQIVDAAKRTLGMERERGKV